MSKRHWRLLVEDILEYIGKIEVDLDIIWRIVTDELPALKAQMRELLAS